MSGDRPATLRYLNQIGCRGEQPGFDAVLTPTGAWCEDAWLTTAMISRNRDAAFPGGIPPGLISPTLAAQMAATFQWQSGGGCCSTWSPAARPRTAGVRRLPRQGRAVPRCGEFLEWSAPAVASDPEPVTLRRPAHPGRRTHSSGVVPTRPRRCTSADRRAGRAGRREVRRHLPHLGRAACRGGEKWTGSVALPSTTAASSLRPAGARNLARHRSRPGPRRTAFSMASPRRHRTGAGEAARRTNPRASAGCSTCTAASSRPTASRRPRGRPNLWSGVGLVRGGAGTALVGRMRKSPTG